MRARKLFGALLTAFGLALVALVVGAYMLQFMLPVNGVPLVAVAVVSFVVGLIILVAEPIEGWLDRSQTALVDGLQAS
jgi:pilus assembly protein TadC